MYKKNGYQFFLSIQKYALCLKNKHKK